MKTATIESTISIKINTGNFEMLDITKSVKCDVSCESMEDLDRKQAALDEKVISATKALAEQSLTEMGRKRIAKTNGTEREVPLWGDCK